MRLYHGTSINNVDSIKDQGLKVMWEGVYLTDSIESAKRWIGFRLAATGEKFMSVVEVEVSAKHLSEGNDHSPLMEQFFGVGKSILSLKPIPKSKIKKIHYFKIGE